jgi:hypothetical protein
VVSALGGAWLGRLLAGLNGMPTRLGMAVMEIPPAVTPTGCVVLFAAAPAFWFIAQGATPVMVTGGGLLRSNPRRLPGSHHDNRNL